MEKSAVWDMGKALVGELTTGTVRSAAFLSW